MSLHHKHLLINAKINKPFKDVNQGIDWLIDLVDQINMKRIIKPIATYIDKPGNRGLTAIVMIETSHIAFHIWDEFDPALIQFDLYTCGLLDVDKVLDIFNKTFEVKQMRYVLFDRENGFLKEREGWL